MSANALPGLAAQARVARARLVGAGLTLLAIVASPLLAFLLFGATGRDDTHITLWASHTLARSGEILNINRVRVEQSSTLLFTVVLAVLEKLTHANLVTLATVASAMAAMGAAYLTGRLARVFRPALAGPAALALAVSPPLVYWSLAGMETTLHACLLIGLVLATLGAVEASTRRRAAYALFAIVAVLFVMNRPEAAFTGALSLTVAGVALALRHGRSSLPVQKTLAAALGLLVGAALIVTVWRLGYFHDVVPQPVRAKTRPIDAHLVWDGIVYLHDRAGTWSGACVLSLAAFDIAGRAWRAVARRPAAPLAIDVRYALVDAFLVVHLAFVVAVGGDWMEYARFVVPLLPLAVVLAVRFLGSGRWRLLPCHALVLVSLCDVVVSSVTSNDAGASPGLLFWRRQPVRAGRDYSWFEARNRAHADDIQVVETISRLVQEAKQAGRRRVVVYSGQAGMVFYHLGMRFGTYVLFVDTRGLATRQVTRCHLGPKLEQSPLGVVFEYSDYFRNQDAWTDCGMPTPDIIFDLFGGEQQVLVDNGYAHFASTSGSHVRPPESIYVRREWPNPAAKAQ